MINWACVPTTCAYAYICTLYKQLFEIADIDHTKTDRQFDKKKKKPKKINRCKLISILAHRAVVVETSPKVEIRIWRIDSR